MSVTLTLVIIAIIGFGLIMWSAQYAGPALSKWWFGEWEKDPTTGEWYKVAVADRWGKLLEDRSNLERRWKAAHARKYRRSELLKALIMFALGAGVLIYFNAHRVPFFDARHGTLGYPFSLIGTGIVLFFACIFCICGVIFIFKEGSTEAGYIGGFIHMDGAQELHPPPPPPPGPESLKDVKPYGPDAPANAADLHRLLSRKSRGNNRQPPFRN